MYYLHMSFWEKEHLQTIYNFVLLPNQDHVKANMILAS